MKKHLLAIFIIIIVAFTALSGRVVYINSRDSHTYKTNVLNQHINSQTSTDIIEAKRGSIVDRNGIVLAESVRVYNVIYDPIVVNKKNKEVIEYTNSFLQNNLEDITMSQLEELIINKSNSHYEIIARELDYNDVKVIDEAIKNKKIQGVFLESSYKRIYPYNTMASDIIGFFNEKSGGSYGVEETYESDLKGENGRLFGAFESEIIINQEEIAAKDGNKLLLTLDYSIQKHAEEAILKYTEEHEAKSINVLMMDPQNGEILASASYPNFNLNDPYNLSNLFDSESLSNMTNDEKYEQRYNLWKNFLFTDSYEPGSTFKPFILSAALEENKTYLNKTYECSGGTLLHGHYIRCWKYGGHGVQTAAEALANSCNVAFMEIGEDLGKNLYFNYKQIFGFDSRTNIDILGEGNSILNTYEKIGPVELATGSFGQGFNITPIQLITAFSSLINGGYLYEPYVVKDIMDSEGRIIQSNSKRLIRQTISETTSKEIIKALEMTVSDGTGNKASIEGYRIGGKTGTSEKGNRDDDKYIISFIGFAPVDNPQIITLVIIDEPQEKETADSSLASGIFFDIMTKVLPYKAIFSYE